jgi:hypothetical protein
MSRVQKFGSRRQRSRTADKSFNRDGRKAILDQTEFAAEIGLPSRRVKHPSNKAKMTKWFYRALISLFLLLLIGLLMWGRRQAGL